MGEVSKRQSSVPTCASPTGDLRLRAIRANGHFTSMDDVPTRFAICLFRYVPVPLYARFAYVTILEVRQLTWSMLTKEGICQDWNNHITYVAGVKPRHSYGLAAPIDYLDCLGRIFHVLFLSGFTRPKSTWSMLGISRADERCR